MEVVLSIGHHPAVTMGACATGSLDMNELEIMGGLLGESLRVTTAETVDLPVPADSEIAIEGVIDPNHISTDGPLAEFTGYFGEGMRPCNIIQVTALTMRKDAIYHDLASGQREHNMAALLGLESNTYEVIRRAVPTVKAVHFPPSGCCAFLTYVSIEKRVQGEGKVAGLAALTGASDAKVVIVVDEDIDVYDEQEVLWALATRVRPDNDISIIPGVTGVPLDPTSYDETYLKRGGMTSKVIIDATKPADLPFPVRITVPGNLWQSMDLEDYLK